MKEDNDLELESYVEDSSHFSNNASISKSQTENQKSENSSESNKNSSLVFESASSESNKKSSFFFIDEEYSCKNIIEQFIKIEECSILKYGIKISTEKISFGFCYTCDSNLMTPICKKCLRECHLKYGHDIRDIDYQEYILCGCGEKMHKMIGESKKKIFKNIKRMSLYRLV